MKKFKSVWPVLIITVLVITLMLGSFSSLVSAFDAQDYTSAAFFSGKMEKKVKLTEDFNVPDAYTDVDVTVKAPDRTIVADNKDRQIGSVTAMQLGNYIITYTKGKNSYSYNVYCYQEKEYFINVKATDKDFIPGYRRARGSADDKGKEADGVIKLPYFELAYKNDKGEIVPVDGAYYEVDYPLNSASIRNRPDKTPANADNLGTKELYDLSEGLMKIELRAKFGVDTQKWYTQEYSVNVQKNFVNEGTPTISVTNFSSSGNLNTLYTLPTATAKDSFDNNVFVNVKVIGPDGNPVKHYDANEDGYADLDTDPAKVVDVVFDNKDVKSFYLTQEGDYKVTYQSVNGSGTPSIVQTYSIKDVTDKLAPVIKKIEETQIPNKWGIEKVSKGKKSGDKYVSDVRPEGTMFTIPFPDCIDNYSQEKDMTLTINLVNPNNRTIGNWTGKISEYAGDGLALSELSTYKDYFKTEYQPTANKHLYFKNTGMAFSFDWINFENSRLNRDAEKLGDWTLTYSLRDEANNGGSGSARKSYTITVQQSFADLNPPTVSKEKFEADIPKYVMVNEGGESFRIPSVTVSDDNATSRIEIEYYIKTEIMPMPTADITIDGEVYKMTQRHDVKGGEEYKVHEHTDGKYYVLINEDDKNLAMPLSAEEISRISIFYVAIDNVGNRSEELTGEFKIIYAGNVNAGYELEADFQMINDALATDVEFEAGTKDPVTKQLATKKLGGFDITGLDKDSNDTGFPDREYTGFEIRVLDEKDNSQEITSYAYFRKLPKADPNDESEKQMYDLHVRNIEFIPSYGGDYRLNVRVFDISGKSRAYGFPFYIKGPKNGSGTVTTAAKIGSTGETNVSYELESEYVITPADKYHDIETDPDTGEIIKDIDNGIIVRYIKGRAYALVGNEFTALDASTYRITDYTYDFSILDAQNGFNIDFSAMTNAQNGHHQKTYKQFVSSNPGDKPVIEVLGVIPSYHVKMADTDGKVYEENAFITLPAITAYTKYGNADVTVKVTYDGVDTEAKELFSYINDEKKEVLTFDETRKIAGVGDEAETEVDNESTGRWAFPTAKDGLYTITISATMPKSNVTGSDKVVQMRVGKTALPSLTVSEASRQVTAKVGDKFKMGKPEFADSDWETVTIKLLDANGAEVSAATLNLTPSALSNRTDWTSDYEFEKAGNYTVVVIAKDSIGLESEVRYTLTVNAAKKTTPGSMTALTTVLIIIGILLILGVVVYVIRFKPVKKEKK